MCFKWSNLIMLLLLPILISSKPTVESSEKSTKQPIRCEYYDLTCVREAYEKGTDTAKCKEIKHCPNQYCFTVWKNQTENQNETKSNNSRSSGFDVKMMGCLESGTDLKISTLTNSLLFVPS